MLTIPNILTISRIIAIPVIILLYLEGNYYWALVFCVLSALSDFFDGRLARKLNQCSTLGSFLDPIADKFFEMSILLVFYLNQKIPLYFLGLLWTRNILQLLSIPILGWWKKISFKVEPKLPAKWASAMGMVVIIATLLALNLPLADGVYLEEVINFIIIPISSVLELYMLVTYIPRFVQILRGTHDTFH